MMHRAIPFLLTLFSGAAALAHELIWTRRLIDLLGASAETFSKVIGCFFIGLAFGAWYAARRPVPRIPWRGVAIAELAVALLALPALALGWDSLGSHPQLLRFKLLLSALLIVPPAFAMGLVLPWIIAAAYDSSRSAGFPVRLYALNTLGGCAGIVVTLLWSLPTLGLTLTGLCACGLNVLIASVAFAQGRGKVTIISDQSRSKPALPFRVRWLAFWSGFLVLSLEVVVQHQLAQLTINSIFSSATVLVMVLLALALASALVPWIQRFLMRDTRVVLLMAALACVAQPFVLSRLRPGLSILPYELTVGPYLLELSWLGWLAICPLFVVTGLVFPMLLRELSEHNQTSSARSVGTLLAWNGLGGWLGTELTQGWIVPRMGLWTTVILIGVLYLVLAGVSRDPILSTQLTLRRIPRFAFASAFLLAGGLALIGWQQSRRLPQATILPTERLAALRVGREGVVATLECGPGDWRMLFNNSYTLGGSKAQFNQERQAHLPILLHGRAKTVACLGVATGSTVAGAALHHELKHIDAIELSPLVLDYARQFFAPYNRNVFTNERVSFIQEDARRVIAQRAGTYDVVTGDLFLPWRTGEGRLFTREHFEAVRRSLKPGGLYCQWLPMFQLTRPQFETIARTFREVFPDAFALRGDFYAELPILGLVGGRSLAQIDWPLVESACERLRRDGEAKDPLVRHVEGVAMTIIGELPVVPPGPVNTLANAWLEWDAGRNILGMKTPWFIGVPCAEWVRDVQRASASVLPDRLQAAHEDGQFFLTLEVVAKLKLPQFAQMESQINERLPKSLREDTGADWSHWPMRVKPEPIKTITTNTLQKSAAN